MTISVCIVCPQLYPPLYGNSRMAWELAKRLCLKEMKVCAVSTGSTLQTNEREDISLLELPVGRWWNPASLVSSIRALKKHLIENRVDIIHGHGLFSAVLTILCRLMTGQPTVQTVNGTWPVFYIGHIAFHLPRLIKTVLLRCVEAVVCSNSFVADYLHGSRRLKRLTIIPYGIEDTWFKSRPASRSAAKAPEVVFFGDGTYERGLGTLLSAVPRVLETHPEARFVVAIRDWRPHLRQSFLESMESFGPNLELIEYPISGHISEIVSRGDVVALPFSVNSMEPPLSLVEAMALAKPVVTTDIGGNRELIGDDENGILIKPNDSNQLSEAIITLLSDEKQRFAIGQRASDYITERYNNKYSIDSLIKLYSSLMR